jgi:hypothetical protein
MKECLFFDEFDGRKGDVEDEGVVQEGSAQRKDRKRILELSLIFTISPKLSLAPPKIYLNTPSPTQTSLF